MKPFQPPTTDAVSRRFVGVFLFLAVFFLPLHFHVAVTTPQLAKECSCIHGSRTEAGLEPPPAKWLPAVTYQLIEFCFQTELVLQAIPIKAGRAPPSLVSL